MGGKNAILLHTMEGVKNAMSTKTGTKEPKLGIVLILKKDSGCTCSMLWPVRIGDRASTVGSLKACQLMGREKCFDTLLGYV